MTAAGEAFMTDSTGNDADPFPGVVLFYGTDEEDGYASRQIVLAPGKSVTFRSPWNIAPTGGRFDVDLQAFFLDLANNPNRGSYTLTIEETGEQAAAEHTKKASFDGIITDHPRRSVNIDRSIRPVQTVNIDRSHTTSTPHRRTNPTRKPEIRRSRSRQRRPASLRGA